MKIQRVKISNFLIHENLDWQIDGANIVLLADNGAGKSSFMRAIKVATGIEPPPPMPITRGKSKAHIEVFTNDNGQEYKFEATFDANKKYKITVTSPDGIRDDRKGVIAGIVGYNDKDMDIFEFVELSKTDKGRKDQVEYIKSFFPDEYKARFKRFESSIQNRFDDRTELNRKIKTLEGFINESPVHISERAKYAQEIDVAKKQEQYVKAVETNNQVKGVKERITERSKEIADLEQRITLLKQQQAQAEDWLANNKEQDTSELQKEINEAVTFNQKVREMADLVKKIETRDSLKGESEEMTINIDQDRQALVDAIRDASVEILPEGLTFDVEQLYYNGLPVHEGNLSTSEIMILGAKIATMRNQNLKVLFVEKGESIGSERLKQLLELCKNTGYQLLLEEVKRGKEELTFEFIGEETKETVNQ